MRKTIIAIIITALFVLFAPAAYAEQSDDFSQIVGEINDELERSADPDVTEFLDEENISVENSSSITDISIKSVLSAIAVFFSDSLKKPAVMLGKILAVSIVCAAIRGMSAQSGNLDKVYNVMCILSAIIIMTDTISESFQTLNSGIESMNRFMVSYIPIYVSVLTAGGSPAGAGCYGGATLFLCEAMAVVTSQILIPFLSVVLAVTLVSAVNPQLKFAGIADSVKRLTTWGLSTVMTLFMGLLSIQGATGAAADNLAVRTLRFTAASFIPVIGNSISEALSAVRGSMGVIKASVGSIGIIIVFITAIKPIITIMAIKITIWIGRIANDLLGQRETAEFLKSTNSVLSIGLSILIAFAVAFVIATSVIMKTAAGG